MTHRRTSAVERALTAALHRHRADTLPEDVTVNFVPTDITVEIQGGADDE